MNRHRILAAIALVALLAGCTQAANGTVPPTAGPTPPPAQGATSTPATVAPGPTDTPPPNGPLQETIGAVVDINCGGTDCMHVAVDKVQFAASYKGQYYNDTPDPGNVYVAFHVTYKAVGPGANFSLGDWSVYVDNQATTGFTSVLNGPKPELSVGQLPQGKSAAGWIVQQVPKTGKVVIAYQPAGSSDIFEVVARAS